MHAAPRSHVRIDSPGCIRREGQAFGLVPRCLEAAEEEEDEQRNSHGGENARVVAPCRFTGCGSNLRCSWCYEPSDWRGQHFVLACQFTTKGDVNSRNPRPLS